MNAKRANPSAIQMGLARAEGGAVGGPLGILPSAKVVRVGSGASCEGPFVTYVCPRDGTRVQYRQECKEERLCPECSLRWAWGAGASAAWRLDHVRLLYGLRAPRHVVVSFDAQRCAESAEELSEVYAEAWAVLEAWGCDAGALIYHPERHDGERFVGGGPHVHGLVWGPDGSGNVGVLADGVVVKFIGARSELQPVLAYLLNHAGFVPRRHVVRYYGLAAYNQARGVPDPPPGDPGVHCPQCGCLMTLEDGSFEPVFDPVSRTWVGGWAGTGQFTL